MERNGFSMSYGMATKIPENKHITNEAMDICPKVVLESMFLRIPNISLF